MQNHPRLDHLITESNNLTLIIPITKNTFNFKFTPNTIYIIFQANTPINQYSSSKSTQ